jgi:hypothetical protein
MLSTVWSAPNYCYRAGNLASILEISPSLERYFNVFGPCPEEHREGNISQASEVVQLIDTDGVEKRRAELENFGFDKKHSLYEANVPKNPVIIF